MPRSSTTWAPGRSGNPAGYPRDLRTIRDLAREHSESAIRVLAEILNDPELGPQVRIAAASELLSRAWGKPVAEHRIATLDSDPVDPRFMTTRALEALVASFATQQPPALALPADNIVETVTNPEGA